MPAGIVEIDGEFARQHRDEIRQTIRNQAERERSEHPMNRLMALDDTEGGLRAATTDIHSAQRIGEAVHRAFQGELAVDYGKDEYSVRVTWRR